MLQAHTGIHSIGIQRACEVAKSGLHQCHMFSNTCICWRSAADKACLQAHTNLLNKCMLVLQKHKTPCAYMAARHRLWQESTSHSAHASLTVHVLFRLQVLSPAKSCHCWSCMRLWQRTRRCTSTGSNLLHTTSCSSVSPACPVSKLPASCTRAASTAGPLPAAPKDCCRAGLSSASSERRYVSAQRAMAHTAASKTLEAK